MECKHKSVYKLFWSLDHLNMGIWLITGLFADAGVDLSCIVKVVPAVSSDDNQEEQTHEVLQVSLDPADKNICFLHNL